MSEYTPDEIKHHIKTYITVFIALAALTIVTVAISYLDLTVIPAVILAMVVATIKGSLVASYFMHLISERVAIYWTLFITAAFFILLLALPLGTMANQVKI